MKSILTVLTLVALTMACGKESDDKKRGSKGGTHGFYPDFKEIQTGFVAFGNGIRKGGVIPQMGLVDIAPLISKLLQLDMPAGDGLLLNGALAK